MTLHRRKSGLDERSGDGKKKKKDQSGAKTGCKKSLLLLLLQEGRPERKSTSHAKYKRTGGDFILNANVQSLICF